MRPEQQWSLWGGGGSTSGSYASCTSFTTNGYQSQPPQQQARNPFLSRSRSQGRDPRLTDIFRAGYHAADDTLSRDSGCSSANFEESEGYFAPIITSEEVASRGVGGSVLLGQSRGNNQPPVRGIIRQQSFPRESYPSGYYGLDAREDSMSLQEGGFQGWDSLSLRSLDSHAPLSWSPLSSGFKKHQANL